MNDKIQKLEEELRLAKQEAAEKRAVEQEQKNYERFLERESDWLIGKAHADIGKHEGDYSWHDYGGLNKTIGNTISIHGNSGTSYNARVKVTDATYTYFHNVWTYQQQQEFQEKLNKVALEEIEKIMSDPHNVIEIMGLQSTNFFLTRLYPKDKIKEIEAEIHKEQDRILDQYTEEELRNVKNLSHGQSMLARYLSKKYGDKSE
jgi:hypothetical protein